MLEYFGIVQPELIKVWWVALVLVACALRLALATRVRSPGLVVWLLVASAVALLPRNSRLAAPKWPNFNPWPEVVLALALTAFVTEALYRIVHSTDRAGGRRILTTAAGVALLLSMIAFTVGIRQYPDFDQTAYYLRMDTTLAAIALLAGALWHVYRWEYPIPRALVLNAALGLLMLLPIFAAGLQQSHLRDRRDLWPWRIGLELWQITCLTAWLIPMVGRKDLRP